MAGKRVAGGERLLFGRPSEVPQGFGTHAGLPRCGSSCGKGAPDSCGRQFFQGDGQLPGKANLVNERLRQPQLEVGQDEEPRPAVRRSGSAQFGGSISRSV